MRKKLLWLLVIGLAVTFPKVVHNAEMIVKKKNLVRAIIAVESNFNPNAVSKKGAIGLMQIRPVVWSRELKKEGIIRKDKDLFDPDINVQAGVYILNKLIAHHKGDLDKVLHHYSGGAKGYKQKVIQKLEEEVD